MEAKEPTISLHEAELREEFAFKAGMKKMVNFLHTNGGFTQEQVDALYFQIHELQTREPLIPGSGQFLSKM